ncbi:MAG: NUDIX hydrolase [Nanoarchaeota archaeon]|nr:NUDIX hydrolase [Nanoarchaeota archaeon]
MDNIIKLINGILEKDNRILLIKKIKYQDYTFPGGKYNNFETDSEALQREVFEEIGVGVTIKEMLGEYSFESDNRRFNRKIFKVDVQNGTPQICEPDIFSEIIYVTPKEALSLNLAPNIESAIIDNYKL